MTHSKIIEKIMNEVASQTEKWSEEEERKMLEEAFADVHIPEELTEEYQDFLQEWHDGYGNEKSTMLKKIREAGFKPIAITTMICEETFVFRSEDEAKRVAKMFLPEGWWYSLKDFDAAREAYVKRHYEGRLADAPEVHWLDKNFEPKEEEYGNQRINSK